MMSASVLDCGTWLSLVKEQLAYVECKKLTTQAQRTPLGCSVDHAAPWLWNHRGRDIDRCGRHPEPTRRCTIRHPVRKLLGETRLVLLSPDGLLHLVPCAALVDKQERYLLDQYRFIYLTTGRDLLRLQVKTQSTQGPVVIANPAFGTTRGAEGNRGVSSKQDTFPLMARGRETVDFSQLSFSPNFL